MALVVVGNVVQLRCACQLGSQISINVRHFRVSAISGTGVADDILAGLLDAAVAPFYKALLPTTATYLGSGVQIIRPLPPQIEQVSLGAAGAGTVAGDPLPPATSGLVSLRTNTATRKGRGRVYVPFPSESDNGVTAAPSAGYITRMDNLMTVFVGTTAYGTPPNTSTLIGVVYNRLAGTTIDLTGIRSRSNWAQQRRRSFLRRSDISPFG